MSHSHEKIETNIGLMAVNVWKTFAMAKQAAPLPVLAPDVADARA